jgi:hypothetical protein
VVPGSPVESVLKPAGLVTAAVGLITAYYDRRPDMRGMGDDSLSAWLEGFGLERYPLVFTENGVDLDTLPLLRSSSRGCGRAQGRRPMLPSGSAGWRAGDGLS